MATYSLKVLTSKSGRPVFKSDTNSLNLKVSTKDEIKISLDTNGEKTGKATIWFMPRQNAVKNLIINRAYSLTSDSRLKRKDDYMFTLDIDERGCSFTVNEFPGGIVNMYYDLEVTSSEQDRPQSGGGGDGAVGSLNVSTG